MTGTASSRGKIYMDFDSYKNQEWLRRRKLRLEQVRKQSNEIARALRQKVSDDEKRKLEEYERLREERFRIWKAEKLEELEGRLKCALQGFGAGYRLAEEEPDPELLLEEKIKLNLSKAQKRGETAWQEQLRKNKLAKEKLTSSIDRKKLTRKREDLRSALVRTVPIKKQFIDIEELCDDADQTGKHTVTLVKKKVKKANEIQNATALQRKVAVKNKRKKQQANHKHCACRCKQVESDNCPAEEAETVWINLDEIQTSSAGDSGPCFRSSKSTMGSKRNQKEKSEGSVEFYDFSSRYYCKSFREYPHLVERINHDSQELNANELAKVEEEMEKEEAKKKLEADAVSQGRGVEALRKEKISRDYIKMMSRLEELSKKEKILKAQQRNPPSFLHMNDERLSERTKTKQRIMESKFESVYYEATASIPQTGLLHSEPLYNLSGGGDYFEVEERPTTKLSFSASNLKHNTPATSSGNSCVEVFPPDVIRRPERPDSQRQLLININKTLREGRELRKTNSSKWKFESSEGEESPGSDSVINKVGAAGASPEGTEKTSTKCQESQTEDLKGVQRKKEREEKEKEEKEEEEEEARGEEVELRLKGFDKGGDESLPLSSSTSYKSPPSVMRCHRLQVFLDYLEGLSEADDQRLEKKNSKIKRKVNTILHDLLPDGGSSISEKENEKLSIDPTLRFYIERLLDMSRECIANLSVSSENISTPNITDLDVKNDSEEADSEDLFWKSSKGEDLIRKSRLERADALEKSIKNWKMILERKSAKRLSEPENVPVCPHPERVEGDAKETAELFGVTSSPKIKSRYDQITKKCSERILELSGMLDKVRKDKEKLLGSASGGSTLNLSKDGKSSEKGFDVEEEEVVPVRRKTPETPKTSPVLECFMNRYNLVRPREETVSTTAVADSQSIQDLNESMESWPDVMDELLKREILTSPFKWSDGELSSELATVNEYRTKPSSIESLIGNFRKEIDKIKPFSLTDPGSEMYSPSKPRWSTHGEYLDLYPDAKGRSSPAASGIESDRVFQEESSVDSINHCLTSLGLNWAKSFLRKNAESKARSSSSNSEKKSSGDEEENFP